MTFGEKLQKLRAREGLSQDALAELLNVSRQAVSRWERDETMPETEKVVRISDHFSVTTDYLLKDGPEQFPPVSRPLPEAAELWNKYGFVLGWLLAAWGFLWTLPAIALLGMTVGKAAFLDTLSSFLAMAARGVSIITTGVLLARRWRRAGRFRRQDLGWALVLGGGLCLFAVLLSAVLDWFSHSLIPYDLHDTLEFPGDPVLFILLGFLLALLPPRKRRKDKSK